jgi:SAM-dependent methyltransferase
MATNWEGMWSRGLARGQAFDANQPEPALVALMERHTLPTGRALVPGCGRGYSVVQLASPERTALGLDIAPTGVAAARDLMAEMVGGSELESQVDVQEADFFSADLVPTLGQFDVVYDCTFLCAIQPDMRKAWAEQMNKLLQAEGELITLIFPNGPLGSTGPPFTINEELVRSLLEPHGFKAIEVTEVPADQLARGQTGSEVIAIWKRDSTQ